MNLTYHMKLIMFSSYLCKVITVTVVENRFRDICAHEHMHLWKRLVFVDASMSLQIILHFFIQKAQKLNINWLTSNYSKHCSTFADLLSFKLIHGVLEDPLWQSETCPLKHKFELASINSNG
jgi:hypothetical protein